MASPLRMCVVCRKMQDKASLIRIAKNKDGSISVDVSGKMPGRGAYICADGDCAARSAKSKSLERSFKCAIPTEIFNALNKKIGE